MVNLKWARSGTGPRGELMETKRYRPKGSVVATLVCMVVFASGACLSALMAGGSIIDEPDPNQRVGRWICFLLFGVLAVYLSNHSLRHIGTFVVDDNGFDYLRAFGRRRYPWGDLVAIRQVSTGTEGYWLVFTNQRDVNMRFSGLTNGEELKAWMNEYVVPFIGDWLHKPEPEQGDIVSTFNERYTLLALNLIVIPVLIFGALLKTGENWRNAYLLWPLIIGAAFGLFASVEAFARRIVLTADTLKIQRLLKGWSLMLADIWEIRLEVQNQRNTPVEILKLITMDKAYRLPSNESEYVRLRNSLIERAPMASVIDLRPEKERTYLPRVDFVAAGGDDLFDSYDDNLDEDEP